MAEDIRNCDSVKGDLIKTHKALVKECLEQSRNALYTSTSFFIWLRCLKIIRNALWVAAAISGVAAASISSKPLLYENMNILVAALSLLAVVFPAIIKALRLEEAIKDYSIKALEFKNVEGALRRAANVWSNKPYEEFEKEAKIALEKLDIVREGSLTPPERCFKIAQKKIRSEDYDPDPV
ncbi:MAG: hypothetical protein OXC62_12425 [Aestuariivita sp.]|nr:hypothetical protein [Aestuariivita sp.]